MGKSTLNVIGIAAIGLLCVAAHKRVQSPKAAEQSAQSGAQMIIKTVAQPSILGAPPIPTSFVIGPPRTNFIYHKHFEWLEDEESLLLTETFTLYMGTSPGVYDWWTDTGTNLFYDFIRTNWPDRMDRHFVVVTAKDAFGFESPPSNEVHFPPFSDDHIELSWSNTWADVIIYSWTDPRLPKDQWPEFAYVVGTNTFSTNVNFSEQCRFFMIDKPDVLTIRTFNPNP